MRVDNFIGGVVRDGSPLIEGERPYTIDHSNEQFATQSEASRAAASKVFELRKSIAIYKNGEPIELRRF